MILVEYFKLKYDLQRAAADASQRKKDIILQSDAKPAVASRAALHFLPHPGRKEARNKVLSSN